MLTCAITLRPGLFLANCEFCSLLAPRSILMRTLSVHKALPKMKLVRLRIQLTAKYACGLVYVDLQLLHDLLDASIIVALLLSWSDREVVHDGLKSVLKVNFDQIYASRLCLYTLSYPNIHRGGSLSLQGLSQP
jgi:hypothetical protein